MTRNTVQESERVIQCLEELDRKFFSIKNNLREIRAKIGKMAQHNHKLVASAEPWNLLFGVPSCTAESPLSELACRVDPGRGHAGSPATMHFVAPKNPFTETGSSELLNRSFLRDYRSGMTNESSNTIVLNRTRFGKYEGGTADSEENESNLEPFSLSALPDLFQEEPILVKLYDFIDKRDKVTEEELFNEFSEESSAKIRIFINLLCQKQFIRRTGDRLSNKK